MPKPHFSFLPQHWRQKIKSTYDKNVYTNIFWLVADKVIRMGGGLIVGLLMARYLGPTNFGLINFAFAFVWLFGYLATLGIDEIATRELITTPAFKNEILGTSFVLKIMGGLLVMLLIGICLFIKPFSKSDTAPIIIAFALSMFLKTSGVIKLWFDARLHSKLVFAAENSAFLIASVLKILFVMLAKPVSYFAWVAVVEVVFSGIIYTYLYMASNQKKIQWVFNKARAITILKDSWPLILTGLSIMIYVKSDQVLLGILAGEKEAGIYAAAAKISEIWYFIPTAIVVSVFPSIIKAKALGAAAYKKQLQQMFDIMAVLSVSIAIPVSFCANWVVSLLYGKAYANAGTVLSLHVWSGIFVFLGVASSKYFIVENLQKNNFYRTLFGAIINVLLNLVLIPPMGAVGSALATVISYGVSVFGAVFFPKSRQVCWLMLQAFNFKRIFLTLSKP